MRHIYTSIVSRHLATRYNNKILRTPPPHISSSDEILLRLNRRTLAQLRTNKSASNHTYTKSTPNHTHHHDAPSVTRTHTTHIISSTAPTYHPGFVDRPCWSDCTADQMDGEVGWWNSSGKIGLPPLAGVM